MKSFGAAANFGKTSTQFVNRCDGWSGSAPLRFQLEAGGGVHGGGGFLPCADCSYGFSLLGWLHNNSFFDVAAMVSSCVVSGTEVIWLQVERPYFAQGFPCSNRSIQSE